MKKILLIAAMMYCAHCSRAQARMVMTVKDQNCDIMGYNMDPDGTGNKNSISLFGAMQSAQATLQISYAAGTPVSIIEILITGGDGSSDSRMELKNVTVYAIKEYVSTYSNGIFNVTASPYINTEIKCRFESLMIHQNSSGEKTSIKNELTPEKLNSGTEQMWDIHPDKTLTGITGKFVLQMPGNISYAHLQIFNSGDTKVVASLFGNGERKLLPGSYDVLMEKYSIKNIPVEKGESTRLKLGIFDYSSRGSVEIIDRNNQKISMAGPFKIALPPGTYYLDVKKEHSFVIRDGEVTVY